MDKQGRLTERDANGGIAVRDLPAAPKAYEDAEEQGRLVRLPCKVGDTVYQVGGAYNKRVYESKIKRLIYDTGGIAFDGRAIGETVFLTRAEAEAALKGGGV